MQQIISKGNYAVVINGDGGKFWANLYVNARNGIDDADITTFRCQCRTLRAVTRWAEKQLASV